MQKEQYQTYCDKLYQSKSRKEWDNVCNEIKQVTANDEEARKALRNYLSKIKEKKFQYFDKYDKLNEKRTFPIKKTVLLDESLSKKIEQYYDLLILEKKLEIQNKYNINLN
ncbi:MAG: hypothetical protein J6V33_03200 [Bacteroidales bacterium]|nr:hypothetical protein [Bacteroidales bacterium]